MPTGIDAIAADTAHGHKTDPAKFTAEDRQKIWEDQKERGGDVGGTGGGDAGGSGTGN